MKERKEKPFDEKQWVVWTLRKASYRTKMYSAVRALAKVPVPLDYPNKRLKFLQVCASCKGAFPQKETQVDHIEPVVPITGWTKVPGTDMWDFTPIIYRLLLGKLQVLCKACHQVKSNLENGRRRAL